MTMGLKSFFRSKSESGEPPKQKPEGTLAKDLVLQNEATEEDKDFKALSEPIPIATVKKWSNPILTPGQYGRFPNTMTLQYAAKGDGRMEHHFALVSITGEETIQPLYAVTINSATRSSLVIHSEPNIHSPLVSFAGQERAFRSGGMVLTARPKGGVNDDDDDETINHAERMSLHPKWKMEIYRFRSHVGEPGTPHEHYENFEWRRKSGENEDKSIERRLVRMSTSTPDHEDIVCRWSGKGWWRKWEDNSIGTFTFEGAGATGEMGPRWTLMVVTTALRAVSEDMTWKELGGLAKDGTKAAAKAAWLAGMIGIRVGIQVGLGA